jgi:hypothetical protein
VIYTLAAVAALATATAQPLPQAWDHWKYLRAIAPAHAGTQTVVIPPSIFPNAQPALHDVRVVNGSGAEVPFTIAVPAATAAEAWTDAKLVDQGYVPGRYAQAVADRTSQRGEYSAIELSTPVTNFSARVDVDVSDGGGVWRTIRTGAPIYDYQQDGLATNLRVAFPVSTARYVRVRVTTASRATSFPIAGIRVANISSAAPQRTRYTLSLAPAVHDATAMTTTVAVAGIADVPIDGVRIDATTPQFSRTVDVQTHVAGGTWQTTTSATVGRVANGPDTLFVDFAEAQAGAWRLVVHDNNNSPLTNITAAAYGLPRRLYFDAESGQTYRLIYGNPAAPEAVYDYAQTHPRSTLERATAVSLALPERNASFESSVPERPWTERNPWVFWLALAIAVAGIGALAVRSLSRPEPKA